MRVLAGMGIYKEVGHNTFAPTPLARTYVTGSLLADGGIDVFVGMSLLLGTHVTNPLTSEQPR